MKEGNRMPGILAGAATRDITPEIGATIQGATVGGVAEFIRDPLEANALYLCPNERGGVLLVSCDFGGLEPRWNQAARTAISEVCGVPERSILIGSTHTGGPSIIPTNYRKAVDEPYLKGLVTGLAELAHRAVANASPALIRYGQGRARIGYNRRCCWADGSHTMFGDPRREDFVGLEGPDDPTHTVIGLETKEGRPMAVLHANTAHPCTFYGANFFSADFPGTARTYLREILGEIPVLFFNGAQGDICSHDITAIPPKESAERELARIGHLLAGETLRLLHESAAHPSLPFEHRFEDVETPVRHPGRDRLAWARPLLERVDAGEAIPGNEIALAHGAVLLERRFGGNPVDLLPVHGLRLGDLALVSNPCELFCRYGLEIRRRSRFPMTAILGLTDGYHGYCPTPAAICGGGYSAVPLYWSRFTESTGDRLVEASVRLLHACRNEPR